MMRTNWPSRAKAKHTVPRQSHKGERWASKRTYEKRRLDAVQRKLPTLVLHSSRFATKAALSGYETPANDTAEARTTHTAQIVGVDPRGIRLGTHRVLYAPAEGDVHVDAGDKLRRMADGRDARHVDAAIAKRRNRIYVK